MGAPLVPPVRAKRSRMLCSHYWRRATCGQPRPKWPSAREVSLRSVFQHFADMEGLHASVAERQMETVLSQARYVPDDGPLPARIQALVAERARLHELITPVRRAGLLHEPFSPAIAERLRWIREQARHEVSKVFSLELARLPPSEKRLVLEILSVATSWTTWEALRRHQGLSKQQAERAMRMMVEALLA